MMVKFITIDGYTTYVNPRHVTKIVYNTAYTTVVYMSDLPEGGFMVTENVHAVASMLNDNL